LLGRAASETTRRRFGLDSMIANYEKLLNNLAGPTVV
jgi:hypothetical protein